MKSDNTPAAEDTNLFLPDAGLLPYRELDNALTGSAGDVLGDQRTGKNGRHGMTAFFRQSVFGRLGGCDDVNDANRLAGDPAIRWIVGGNAVNVQAASTSQMGRFDTEFLATDEKLAAPSDLGGTGIDRVHDRRPPKTIVLSAPHGDRKARSGTAIRGTPEQHIRKGKNAVKWTRLSCRTFRNNAGRLQLHALACNLANVLRTLALPEEVGPAPSRPLTHPPKGCTPALIPSSPRTSPAMNVTFISLWRHGGMVHYASQLTNALARQPGVRAAVVLPRGTDTRLFADDVRQSFVDVLAEARWREVLANLPQLLRLSSFMRTVESTCPDLIHINSSHPWFLAVMPRLRRRHRIVATVHDVDVHPGEDTWRKRLERRAVARGATRLAVHGESFRNRLVATTPGLSPDVVHVIPHGTYDFFGRWATPGRREPATVLFFGRIHTYKGLDVLVDAASELRNRVPRVKFVIAGQGDLRRHRSRLSDATLFEVHNRFVPDESVAAYFQRATLLALPYIEASESGVLHIARAMGLPVVATAVGGLREAIEHGHTGLLVPPRDPHALADAIQALLQDVPLRERIAGNAMAAARSAAGWDEAATQLVHVYRGLLNG